MHISKLLLVLLLTLAVAVPAQAGMVTITYKDVGSDLQFDYSGSLNYAASGSGGVNYSTVSIQGQYENPLFYSSNDGFGGGASLSVTHTPGLFASNLPLFEEAQGISTGTGFLFRLNGASLGPASRIQIWGDWGAANTMFSGRLTLTGQSAAGIGMVDGYTAQGDWGTIKFQAANSVVPEPATATLWGLGIAGLALVRFRKR